MTGAIEGGMEISFDTSARTSGDRSLRLDLPGPARGGVIQRIVVEPDKRYLLSARIQTQGLAGEAFVSFFTGEIHEEQGKTQPLRAENSPWKRFEAKWFSGTSRVVYVACYLEGTRGTVWFDDIELKELK